MNFCNLPVKLTDWRIEFVVASFPLLRQAAATRKAFRAENQMRCATFVCLNFSLCLPLCCSVCFRGDSPLRHFVQATMYFLRLRVQFCSVLLDILHPKIQQGKQENERKSTQHLSLKWATGSSGCKLECLRTVLYGAASILWRTSTHFATALTAIAQTEVTFTLMTLRSAIAVSGSWQNWRRGLQLALVFNQFCESHLRQKVKNAFWNTSVFGIEKTGPQQ